MLPSPDRVDAAIDSCLLPGVMDLRLRHFENMKDSVVSGNPGAPGADKKQEYADRAMELLQQAVQAGYNDAAHMKKDTDLDALREREDFKKLLAELEQK